MPILSAHHLAAEKCGRKMRTVLSATTLAAIPSAAEVTDPAQEAPSLDKVEAKCAACHGPDYIPMNSPRRNAALWHAEVTKMPKITCP